jgi:hypothetical protein
VYESLSQALERNAPPSGRRRPASLLTSDRSEPMQNGRQGVPGSRHPAQGELIRRRKQLPEDQIGHTQQRVTRRADQGQLPGRRGTPQHASNNQS